MIDYKQIESIVNECLTGDQFLVEVTVSSANVINVMVDSDTSLSINQLVEISRYVEGKLDREAEDFELSVFSAGLTEPLRMVRQYKKCLGNELSILLKSGIKISGLLTDVSESAVAIEVMTKEKSEKTGKKELVKKIHQIEYTEIKEAKRIIKF